MSVKVTTPTKTSFGDGKSSISATFCSKLDSIVNMTVEKPKENDQCIKEKSPFYAKSTPVARRGRRSSDKGYSSYGSQNKKKGGWFEKQNQKEKIKLPTKFLLGGNINDPLNLNSLNDEEINKALNAVTPVSSPLPTPSHRVQKVEVLIPPNINDPLNLNSGEDVDIGLISPRGSCKKRKKNKRKKSGSEQTSTLSINTEQVDVVEKDIMAPLSLQIDNKIKKIADSIVSPAIPQDSPKPKRKRTISETRIVDPKVIESPVKSVEKQKFKKQVSSQISQKPVFRTKDDKFIYGNYDRYYGKRNPETEEDKRLHCFQKDWFDGKDVLDIGCNIGHITLSIAKNFSPKSITGMDIDPKLICIARKNIRHYLVKDNVNQSKFPVSLSSTYGPVSVPSLPKDGLFRFPDNINFVQGNYVLDMDQLLELQTEEYDTILGLSLTKWIHLNFGDSGLTRAFKRMYRQLRPGGKLILEPQARSTYKKKKKLNENIWKNYQEIKLWPDKFRKYLLSDEVGFSKCEFLDTPYNRSKGFQRPIMVFTKSETTATTPREVTESRGVTPLMNIDCGGHGLTPRLEGSSYTPTQGYDLHPSFSFSSAHLPIRGYDAFLESQISRALTPTQELTAATRRVGSLMFDIGTPSVSARNTPSQPLNCSDSDEKWFSSQTSNDDPLFDQLSDQGFNSIDNELSTVQSNEMINYSSTPEVVESNNKTENSNLSLKTDIAASVSTEVDTDDNVQTCVHSTSLTESVGLSLIEESKAYSSTEVSTCEDSVENKSTDDQCTKTENSKSNDLETKK